MKQITLAISALCISLAASIAPAFAQNTAYKCADANIMFTPASSGLTNPNFVWTLDGDTLTNGQNGVIIDATTGELKIPGSSNLLSTNAGAASTKNIKLAIAQGTEGCYSTPTEYTVHILPQPVVAIDPNSVHNYCADASSANNATLKAATTAITNLPTGVTVAGFTWTNDAFVSNLGAGAVTNPLADIWESVLTYTSPANTTAVTYSVKVDYVLPAGASLIGACTSNTADVTLQSYATPNTPAITAGGY